MVMLLYGSSCVECSMCYWPHLLTWYLSHQAPTVQGAQQNATSGKPKSLQDYESYPREFVVRRLIVFVGIVVG